MTLKEALGTISTLRKFHGHHTIPTNGVSTKE
jgi:hypothetical protein